MLKDIRINSNQDQRHREPCSPQEGSGTREEAERSPGLCARAGERGSGGFLRTAATALQGQVPCGLCWASGRAIWPCCLMPVTAPPAADPAQPWDQWPPTHSRFTLTHVFGGTQKVSPRVPR